MTILGILSLVQFFLPGYILVRLLARYSRLTTFILSFGLSLVFNFQFVFLATALGIYSRKAVFILFAVEIALLIGILFGRLRQGSRTTHDPISSPWPDVPESGNAALKVISTGLCLAMGILFASHILAENPGIFNSWDDVVSWNRWATEGWYAGKLPTITWHYPQLISANWSITYLFVGSSDIEFFAKASMSFFPVMIFLVFIDLYNQSKSILFLFALAFTTFLLYQVVGAYIGKGYVDIPSAYFALAVTHALTMSSWQRDKVPALISAILLAGGILTKQSVLLVAPAFLIFLTALFNSSEDFGPNRLRSLLGILVLLILIAGPWYIYKQVQIEGGTEASELTYVTQEIFAGKSLPDRILSGTHTLLASLAGTQPGNVVPMAITAATLFILVAFSLFKSIARLLILSAIIPSYLIWGFFYSYDLRNLAVVLPLVGLTMAIGLAELIGRASRFELPIKRKFLWYTVAGLSITGLSVTVLTFNDNDLERTQRAMAEEQLGDAALNGRLYELCSPMKPNETVLSAYAFLRYLPGIDHHYSSFAFSRDQVVELQQILKNPGSPVRALVVHQTMAPEIREFLQVGVMDHQLDSVFRSDAGWMIYLRRYE